MADDVEREKQMLTEIALLRTKVRELEHSERQLQDRLKVQRLMLANLPLKVFFKDVDSRFVSVNQAFAAELNREPADVIGKTDYDFYPAELAEKYQADDRRILRLKRSATLIERHRAHDRDCYVEVTKTPVTDDDGTVLGVMGFFTDVTERMQAEQALEQERYLLVTLMDNIPDSIYFKDEKSRFTRINRALARRFGFDDPREALGKTDFDFFTAEHAEQAFADELELLQSGVPIVAKEEKETWHDGRTTWVSTTKMPLRDRDGRIIGSFGISRDITRRKRYEEELRASKQLLQAILDNTPAMVHVKDTMGRYVMVNKRYEELFHISSEQAIGKTAADLFPAEAAAVYHASDEQVLATGQPLQLEEVAVLDDGPHTYISLKFPLFSADGVVTGVGGISTDITERKRAELAVKQSEALFRQVWDNSFDGMRITDADGNVVLVNPSYCRMVGKSKEELIGKPFSIVYADGQQQEMLTKQQARFSQRAVAQHFQRELVLWNGSKVWFELTNTFLEAPGSEPKLMSVVRDITDRKHAEEALQAQARLLEQQAEELERRNRDLSKAYGDLKDAESQLIHSEKMAAIGQLVAGLAHEINNPAAFVLTNLTVISRDIDDVLQYVDICRELEHAAEPSASAIAARLGAARDELGIDESLAEIRSLIDAAKKGMIRIRDLVANLRSYSRIDTRTEFEMGDLRQGLQATLVLLKHMISKEMVVELDVREDLPLVECNLGQINQVLMNLVVNAIQAVGSKGKVVVSAQRADQGVLIKVQDNGPGIPAAIRSRIFDPFFTTKEVGKGTGLGLSISRRIIDAHGGKIEFTTEEGTGTEFRVWLPLRQSPAPETASDSVPMDSSAG